MKIDDPKIIALREKVTAAQQEFDMAVTFHETWKPAAYDKSLHSRMGQSYASQAFLVARAALRREMVLALMRLWDTNPKAVRMQWIASVLREQPVINALARDRVNRIGLPEAIDQMKDDLGTRAAEAVQLVNKYMEGGSHATVLKKLQALRHERLAHRQLAPTTTPGASATDEEIEEFYQDNSKLIHILLSVVNAMAYDPEDTAKVYRHYAGHFWAAARGERTEGHPNYRPPLPERELTERHAALDNAIATQRLEGLEPDAQTIADLERVVRGEIEVGDVIARLRQRITAGEFKTHPSARES